MATIADLVLTGVVNIRIVLFNGTVEVTTDAKAICTLDATEFQQQTIYKNNKDRNKNISTSVIKLRQRVS